MIFFTLTTVFLGFILHIMKSNASSFKVDNRKDILLLLLYSPSASKSVNEPIVGRTRLVKMLFLFKKEVMQHFRAGTDINEDNFYNFFSWNFGPFSVDVYDDLTFFILRGFIESSPAEEESLPEAAAEWEEWITLSGAESMAEELQEYQEEEFRLTEKGKDFAATLYERLSNEQKSLLKAFKRRICEAPLRAILRYVYTTYPDYTKQSQIKEHVLGY